MTKKLGNYTMLQAALLKQGGGLTKKIKTVAVMYRLGLVTWCLDVWGLEYYLTERGEQERKRIMKASEK